MLVVDVYLSLRNNNQFKVLLKQVGIMSSGSRFELLMKQTESNVRLETFVGIN